MAINGADQPITTANNNGKTTGNGGQPQPQVNAKGMPSQNKIPPRHKGNAGK